MLLVAVLQADMLSCNGFRDFEFINETGKDKKKNVQQKTQPGTGKKAGGQHTATQKKIEKWKNQVTTQDQNQKIKHRIKSLVKHYFKMSPPSSPFIKVVLCDLKQVCMCSIQVSVTMQMAEVREL